MSSWEKVEARVPAAPSPPGGAPAGLWSRRKQRGRHSAGEEAMGAQVRVLLLVQLLVRVELQLQGELRLALRADLGVMGVGWSTWRPRRAHLLSSLQSCRMRT